MGVILLNQGNFEAEVLNAKGVVLVDFFATWCAPCKMLSPIVDQVADEVTNAKVGKINVDEESGLAQKYGVSSIPTLVVFKDGVEVKRSMGFIPKNAVMDLLNV